MCGSGFNPCDMNFDLKKSALQSNRGRSGKVTALDLPERTLTLNQTIGLLCLCLSVFMSA